MRSKRSSPAADSTHTRTPLGSALPAGHDVSGSGEEPSSAVQDDFAPAQFFDLTDADKLASPSFKSFASGKRLAASYSFFDSGKRPM